MVALLATAFILCLHFYLLVEAERFKKELNLILKVLLVGFILEIITISAGALVSDIGNDSLVFFSWQPPLWLMCIWLLFATTLKHSLVSLIQYPILSAVLAFLSAPSSYYAGSLLSPYMSLGDSILLSLFMIGTLWAVSFPLVMRFFVRS